MICPTCKSNIRDDAAFCPVCGKPVIQDTPEIHNIETVELPKKDPVQAAASAASAASEEMEAKQNFSAESAGTADSAVNRQSYQQEAQNTSAPGAARYENVQRQGRPAGMSQENRPQRGTGSGGQGMPGQQNRAYHQYQRGNPQGAAPRPQAMNRMPQQPVRPLNEKEEDRLRNSLSKKSTIAFIFSIFGICGFTFNLPCAIIALIFSMIVKNEYKNRGFQKDTDLKLANAAFICAIIGIVIGVIGLLVLLISGAGIIAGLSSLSSMASGSSYYGY